MLVKLIKQVVSLAKLAVMEQQLDRAESQLSALTNHLCCFGDDVSIVCEQESDCQISPEDAYDRIRSMWLELKDAQPEIVTYLDKIDSI
ncbi:MAG: hypothetical protein QNJ34_21385 [Xenococcaceae cyanobacterium MO_188.B29]|nr:hypothetical protein [Xenococcaceae cyanobacterium MO_188.B29]